MKKGPSIRFQMKGFYSHKRITIEYPEENEYEANEFMFFLGLQEYYLGEKYNKIILYEIFDSLRLNFPVLYWSIGPTIRLVPQWKGDKLSVGFSGINGRSGYQFTCIVERGVIVSVYVRTIFDD